MTWFNALQVALAACAAALIARRMRTLLFEAPLDSAAFSAAIETALSAGQVGLARAIAEACIPAWPARLLLSGLTEGGEVRPPAAVEEARLDLEHAAGQGLGAIVTLGRMASPIAFIGVILEIGRAFGGVRGIEGLQRGLVESTALQRALLTFVLGSMTFVCCVTAASILRRRARRLGDDLRRVAALLEAARTRGEPEAGSS